MPDDCKPGHCGSHDEHDRMIIKLTTTQKVIASVALVFMTLIAYIYNNNSTAISSDLKDIKAYMVASRDNNMAVKGELENIKWRLSALEGKK